MSEQPDRILSEFIDAWNAGRRPPLDEFVARAAPDQREALIRDIAAFAAIAPEPSWSEETLAAVRVETAVLEGLPALLPTWRRRAQFNLDELGRQLARLVGVADEDKTIEYLGQLESGTVDPGGLSRRVLTVLAQLLEIGEEVVERAAAPWRGPALAPPAAMWRAEPEAAVQQREDLELAAAAMAAPAPDPWDEVDELFRGGR